MGENDKKRGGRREGSGRKKCKGRMITFKVDLDLESLMDRQQDRSYFLNACIRKSLLPRMDGVELFQTDTTTPMEIPLSEQRLIAGFPAQVDATYMDTSIDLNKELIQHPASTFYARAIGDSMIDAGVDPGDLLIIDKAKQPTEESLVVCCLDGEFTLKHLRLEGEVAWLVPANKKYPSVRVTTENDFRVWGVVTYIIKKQK
ncbi:MAG: translesion error-prone DNA polymerase V autoproteolytic subunit [Bacteroidales bacterium]|nr:translesion error-prone DNA polymerase V autoproteolytic subunit [Bacteroidales bacterium]MDD4822883.1 translesion error-prone DNA polymerase V autoproteolytic subunit [Bacteroidales bacterium]